MPANFYRSFKWKIQCSSFLEGIAFVNDPTIKVQEIAFVFGAGQKKNACTGNYYVHIIDSDKRKIDGENQPKRWRNRIKNVSI